MRLNYVWKCGMWAWENLVGETRRSDDIWTSQQSTLKFWNNLLPEGSRIFAPMAGYNGETSSRNNLSKSLLAAFKRELTVKNVIWP